MSDQPMRGTPAVDPAPLTMAQKGFAHWTARLSQADAKWERRQAMFGMIVEMNNRAEELAKQIAALTERVTALESPAQPEPVADDPAAPDPVLEEIIVQAYHYGSFRYRQGLAIARGVGVGKSTDEMIVEWEKLEGMIKALDKAVPE